MTKKLNSIAILFLVAAVASSCVPKDPNAERPVSKPGDAPGSVTTQSGVVQITILGTNDIHGGIEPTRSAKGDFTGGTAFFAGAVRAIKTGLSKKLTQSQSRGGVIVVDAGDQFQGTLVSNFHKGLATIKALNHVGYDMVVTGNHDFDFGPNGDWLVDLASHPTNEGDLRGALITLATQASFPMISSNVYYKSSLVDENGLPVQADGTGCKASAGKKIAWNLAKRPSYLSARDGKPYIIKDIGGVKVALIGADNMGTPSTTSEQNVSDVCFRNEADSYLDAQADAEAAGAQVFVLVAHQGNTMTEYAASDMLKSIVARRQAGGSTLIDAVIAGHTHMRNDVVISGVPLIQSESGGDKFGRIDLFWDASRGKILTDKTRHYAALPMNFGYCTPSLADFCTVAISGDNGTFYGVPLKVSYEGEPVIPDSDADKVIQTARAEIADMASQVLATAQEPLKKSGADRTDEGVLGDIFSDALYGLSPNVDVAFVNASGLRAGIDQGPITYEDLFKVMPFNNHAVLVKNVSFRDLFTILSESAKTCGTRGVLDQSGLRVVFERDCKAHPGADNTARILYIAKVDPSGNLAKDEVLYDLQNNIAGDPSRVFRISVLDFLRTGGSGYSFDKIPADDEDLGNLRENIRTFWLKTQPSFKASIDGRWKSVDPAIGGGVSMPVPKPVRGPRR